MAFSKTIFVGNLTKDPELRVTQSGKSVCSFSVAVNRRRGEETDFWDCVAWEKTAEAISKHFHKGKPILLEGEMQKRSYTDKDGNKRWIAELKVDSFSFIGRREEEAPSGGGWADAPHLEDDDLPFF